MPTFVNRLDELLADAVLASGMGRQTALQAVRLYLANTPIPQLKQEVTQIKSLTELRFLQAAGVPIGLQDVYLNTLSILSSQTV